MPMKNQSISIVEIDESLHENNMDGLNYKVAKRGNRIPTKKMKADLSSRFLLPTKSSRVKNNRNDVIKKSQSQYYDICNNYNIQNTLSM